MRMKVVMKFNEEERQVVTEFANQVAMSVDEFCKRAVFYSIRDAYRRAEEENATRGNNTVPSSTEGVHSEAGSTTDSNALPVENDAPTNQGGY